MKKTLLTLSTVAVVSFGGILVGNDTVGAQPSLDEVSQKQEKVNAKLSKAEAKLANTLNEMKEINEEIARINTALKANEKETKKVKEAIKTLEQEVDAINARIEERNDILKDRLAAYQANGGNVQFMEVLFGAKDPIEFLSRADAVATITNSDIELIEENEKDKQLVEEKIAEQEEKKAELEGIAETIEEQKEAESTKVAALKKTKEKYEKEKSKLTTESSELKALENSILAELAAPAEEVVGTSNSTASASTSESSASTQTAASSDSSASKAKKPASSAVAYTGGGGSAIAAGKQFIGKSTYVWGASNPGAGQFDCSGFVKWAYAQEGVSLPRTASAMKGVGQSVSYGDAKPGDLVFFRGGSHVGIYVGGGKFIGSQNSTGVAIADMNSGYWKQHFDGVVKRVK